MSEDDHIDPKMQDVLLRIAAAAAERSSTIGRGAELTWLTALMVEILRMELRAIAAYEDEERRNGRRVQ